MIYLDNSATTLQKPQTVYRAVTQGMRQFGANAGRGGYELSTRAAEEILSCREAVGTLFGVPSPERVVFTKNTTEALNTAIKGILRRGDHAVIGGMEHNSVLRPIHTMAERGEIAYSVARADEDGRVGVRAVEEAMRPDTKLAVISQMSNVCGSISPVEEIAELCRRTGVVLLVDAAQSGGAAELTLQPHMMIAFAGHKGLYGPQGTGGLCIGEEISLRPLTEGGTGSNSALFSQPGFLPDALESGTLPAALLSALRCGTEYVLRRTPERIFRHECALIDELLERIGRLEQLRFFPKRRERCGGIAAFLPIGQDCNEFCARLDREFSIAVRAGLHCAPLAHRSLGTVKSGLVRVSVSDFTSPEEIALAAEAIEQLVKP